ncbi:MAG: hypothetical protein EZS28_017643 [Streblomastix strix]|uniref:Uncharacterized protein n=1 Tax=Streblomastix strix TaxID=222440 RepID=A0A5J4VVW9_9EUKA|nr:MAG: hypothetical protein EZS28_017643 [Streblomastix strix]
MSCQSSTKLDLVQRENLNIQEESLLLDFKKQTIPSSHYCSQTLTTIIRQFEIQSPYNGPSIRHATMTKLRANGASVQEVNAFSRHIITSTVVDSFYYRSNIYNKSQLFIGIQLELKCVGSDITNNEVQVFIKLIYLFLFKISIEARSRSAGLLQQISTTLDAIACRVNAFTSAYVAPAALNRVNIAWRIVGPVQGDVIPALLIIAINWWLQYSELAGECFV